MTTRDYWVKNMQLCRRPRVCQVDGVCMHLREGGKLYMNCCCSLHSGPVHMPPLKEPCLPLLLWMLACARLAPGRRASARQVLEYSWRTSNTQDSTAKVPPHMSTCLSSLAPESLEGRCPHLDSVTCPFPQSQHVHACKEKQTRGDSPVRQSLDLYTSKAQLHIGPYV